MLGERGQRRGRLDAGRLWKVAQDHTDVFKRTIPLPEIDACIGLLVDCSGSMCMGSKVAIARQLSLLLGGSLHRNNTPFFCGGFTTRYEAAEHYLKIVEFKEWGQEWVEQVPTLNFIIVTGKDRKSTRLNSSHEIPPRMPSSA